MSWVVWIGGAYLLGAVPFSLLLVQRLRGVDIRSVGSGNPGATNVLRSAGKLSALTVLLLDVSKGALPVWGAVQLGAPPEVTATAGVAAAMGHVFSIYLRFRGGKGVATALGVLGVLAPKATVAALGLFVLTVGWKRYVSLGSLVMIGSVPLLMPLLARLGWARPPLIAYWLAALAIALLVILRHAGNIRRLLSGQERRLDDTLRTAS